MARKDGKDRGIMQRTRKGKLEAGWWVRIVHQGREIWRKCDTKSQARAVYIKLKAELREGTLLPKVTVTPGLMLRSWLARCLEGCTNRGIANERLYNRRLSLGPLGKKLLNEITGENVKRLQVAMRAKLKPRPPKAPNTLPLERRWGDATINRHLSYLRHVFALVVKDEKITRNPFTGIKFFPEASTTRFLSEEELIRLRGVMQPKDWQVVLLAVETGLRREELFKLRWQHIDLDVGLLTLPLPKGGKSRYVPLSEQAKTILRASIPSSARRGCSPDSRT